MKAAAALLVLLLAGAQADKDAIRYRFWSGFKPGSWVQTKVTATGGPFGTSTHLSRWSLVEFKDDKVVINSSMAMLLIEGLPPSFSEPTREEFARSTKEIVKETGTEEIDVAGKKLKCRTFKGTLQIDGDVRQFSYWVHPDVPGGIVKQETKSKDLTVHSIAEAWEKK